MQFILCPTIWLDSFDSASVVRRMDYNEEEMHEDTRDVRKWHHMTDVV